MVIADRMMISILQNRQCNIHSYVSLTMETSNVAALMDKWQYSFGETIGYIFAKWSDYAQHKYTIFFACVIFSLSLFLSLYLSLEEGLVYINASVVLLLCAKITLV